MGWFVSSKKSIASVCEYPNVTVKERLKKVEIEGFSRMTIPQLYYEELYKKLESCFYNFRNTLIVDFSFEYINTSSAKWLHIILKALQDLGQQEGLVEINWYYEHDDETIKETGELLGSTMQMPFHLKEI